MCTCDEQDVDELAKVILRYLQTHPFASDTAEGIVQWWITRQRVEDTLARVQTALDHLVDASRLEPRAAPDGRVLYLLRPDDAGQGG